VLYRMREDGSGREPIREVSGHVFGTVSPDGEWISSFGTVGRHVMLFSTTGKPPRPVLSDTHPARVRWSRDGTHVYLSIQAGQASGFALGRTYVLPVAPGSPVSFLPAAGFRSEAEIAAVPGVQILDHADIALHRSTAVYAYSRLTATQNLYRIPIR
jgi:hypothetical protein